MGGHVLSLPKTPQHERSSTTYMSRTHTSKYRQASEKLSAAEQPDSSQAITPTDTEPSLSPSPEDIKPGATRQKSPVVRPNLGLYQIRELTFNHLVKIPQIGVGVGLTVNKPAETVYPGNYIIVDSLSVCDEGVVIVNGEFRIPIDGGAILGWR